MHSPVGHQWIMILLATVILRAVCYQELSAGVGPVRVEISADESLRAVVCISFVLRTIQLKRSCNGLLLPCQVALKMIKTL